MMDATFEQVSQVHGESERNSAYVPSAAFPALDWLPCDGGWWEASIAPDPDFWDVYIPSSRALFAVGFSRHLVEEYGERRWFVRFDPTKATPDAVAAAVTAAREKYRVTQLSKSEQQLIAEEADRKRREAWEAGRPAREEAERKRQEEVAARRLAQQTAAHDQAAECLRRWGELCHQKARLRELAEMPIADLWYPEFKEIGQLVAKTELKVRARRVAAENDDAPGVSWPEHIVVAAVEHLTYVDDDHAEVANNRGWSRADSSVGHWCAGELTGGDRELALRAARRLVGKYRVQLTEAGVVPIHLGLIDLPKGAIDKLNSSAAAKANV